MNTSPEQSFAEAQRKYYKLLRLYIKTPQARPESVMSAYAEVRALPPPEVAAHPVQIARTIRQVAQECPSSQYERLEVLRDFVEKHLMEDVVSFIVHGSFATADFIDEWSDLDTFVIIRDEVFLSRARLERFKKFFSRAALACYQVDPLAHHELVAVSEFDVAHYPQTLFPLPLFESAALLIGEPSISFAIRNDAAERAITLQEFHDFFARRVESGIYSTNVYAWKQDVARALLLPALALQVHGEFIYKRESFAVAKEQYPTIDWTCVDEASNIRAQWHASSVIQMIPTRFFLRGMPGRSITQRLLGFARNRKPEQSPADIERLTRSFLELTDSILSHTCV